MFIRDMAGVGSLGDGTVGDRSGGLLSDGDPQVSKGRYWWPLSASCIAHQPSLHQGDGDIMGSHASYRFISALLSTACDLKSRRHRRTHATQRPKAQDVRDMHKGM